MDYKDGLNRKILQEKIGKLRDKNGLALSVPHVCCFLAHNEFNITKSFSK